MYYLQKNNEKRMYVFRTQTVCNCGLLTFSELFPTTTTNNTQITFTNINTG